MTEFDLIIVGNGVLGSSVAYSLVSKNKDIRIGVIGPKARTNAATLAAGAMLNSFAEIEKDFLLSEPNRIKFQMSRKATELWPSWLDTINQEIKNPIHITAGTYVILNSTADSLDDDNFNAILKAAIEFKEKVIEINPKEISGYNPAQTKRALKSFLLPNEGSIDSSSLINALDEALIKKSQIQFIDSEAVKLDLEGSKKKVTTKTEKVFVAKQVLLAAGAFTQDLVNTIPTLKSKVPRIFYGVGTSIRLHSDVLANQTIRTPNRGLACGVHLVPNGNQSFTLGATSLISPTPLLNPRLSSVANLLNAAIEELHSQFYKAEIIETRVGFRPVTEDTFPLIGETSIDGLFILSGTRRDGIHLSPLLASMLSAEILNEKVCFHHPFQPERKPIHTLTKKQGVEKALQHLRSAAYQHGLNLPNTGWESRIDDALINQIEEVYEKSGVTDFGIPPELLDMYRYGHILNVI